MRNKIKNSFKDAIKPFIISSSRRICFSYFYSDFLLSCYIVLKCKSVMLDESKIFYTLISKGFPENNDIYYIEENMISVPDLEATSTTSTTTYVEGLRTIVKIYSTSPAQD